MGEGVYLNNSAFRDSGHLFFLFFFSTFTQVSMSPLRVMTPVSGIGSCSFQHCEKEYQEKQQESSGCKATLHILMSSKHQ